MNKFNLWVSGFCASGAVYQFMSQDYITALCLVAFSLINFWIFQFQEKTK